MLAPNVEIIRNPIEEQLAHALDTMLNAVPENKARPKRDLECFNRVIHAHYYS
jgi:hypothetical protein